MVWEVVNRAAVFVPLPYGCQVPSRIDAAFVAVLLHWGLRMNVAFVVVVSPVPNGKFHCARIMDLFLGVYAENVKE